MTDAHNLMLVHVIRIGRVIVERKQLDERDGVGKTILLPSDPSSVMQVMRSRMTSARVFRTIREQPASCANHMEPAGRG